MHYYYPWEKIPGNAKWKSGGNDTFPPPPPLWKTPTTPMMIKLKFLFWLSRLQTQPSKNFFPIFLMRLRYSCVAIPYLFVFFLSNFNFFLTKHRNAKKIYTNASRTKTTERYVQLITKHVWRHWYRHMWWEKDKYNLWFKFCCFCRRVLLIK